MAARFAKGEGKLAELVRRRQDLILNNRLLQSKITGAMSKPASQRVKSQEDGWLRSADEIERSIGEIDRVLARDFPDYAALANATEAKIKSLSTSGTLKSYRVLHFATHGLIAGETQMLTANQAEPALLLTPPEVATEKDDGLLTASEVAKLVIDADWVILSACNTAAGDGASNAEALSGLASAFLYAGGRSLLVSHWYVNSQAAVQLITQTVGILAQQPALSRSEAMRRSMTSHIRAGGPQSHPSYWAPFIIIGHS
jgi:CHAT domain-containing protein